MKRVFLLGLVTLSSLATSGCSIFKNSFDRWLSYEQFINEIEERIQPFSYTTVKENDKKTMKSSKEYLEYTFDPATHGWVGENETRYLEAKYFAINLKKQLDAYGADIDEQYNFVIYADSKNKNYLCQIGYADDAKENGVGYFFDKKYGLMTRYEFRSEGETIVKVEYYYS